MEDILTEMKKITTKLAEVETRIQQYEINRHFDDWVPRKTLMQFLDYGDTQMAALFKSGDLKISEIGVRKFVFKPSIISLLERNIRKK